MSEGWEGYKPAPIERFHAEMQDRFFEVAEMDTARGVMIIDGGQFGSLIAEFKMKIVKEYNISREPIKESQNEKG